MEKREIIADKIMSYWGYGKEFDPTRYNYVSKKELPYYLEKKEHKFNLARAHAEDLADIAISTLEGKDAR